MRGIKSPCLSFNLKKKSSDDEHAWAHKSLRWSGRNGAGYMVIWEAPKKCMGLEEVSSGWR